MSRHSGRSAASGRPRVIVIGSYPDALGLRADGFQRALAAEADIAHLDGSSALREGVRLYRRAASLVTREGFELVHVLDPRFAAVGAALRRHHAVAATVTLTPGVMRSRTPLARLSRRCLGAFDEAFAGEEALAPLVRLRVPRLPVSIVRPGAGELPWPSPRGVARVARALRGVSPGRLIVGVPWPRNRNDLRWYRDIVMPQLTARPLCLLFGAGSQRDARFRVGAAGAEADFRMLGGRMSGSLIAAVARVVDVFAVPASADGAGDSDLRTALAAGGVPVVSHATARDLVLAHQASGLTVAPGDERGFIDALDGLLGLPAIQRHFLGEDMARSLLQERSWRPAAAAYAERFAALVGRPRIPADLRAA